MRKVIMETCSLIKRIFNEWLVISQMFLFFITSISVSRITRALCKWTTVYDAGFTMIAVIPKFKLTVWSIYMMNWWQLFSTNVCVCLLTLFKHLQIGINISYCNLFPNPINYFLLCNVYSWIMLCYIELIHIICLN